MIHFLIGKKKGDLYQHRRFLYKVKWSIGPLVISERISWGYSYRTNKEMDDIFDQWNYK